MQNSIFISQESSQYLVFKTNPYVNRIFFAFCVYKKVLEKNYFLYINENYNDFHQQNTAFTFQYIQKVKNCETLLYTKIQTHFKKQHNFRSIFIYKKQDTLRYSMFHKFFEVEIYIQLSWHFALSEVFIYKRPESSQKERQSALRFYIQKSGHFTLRDFHWIVEIGGGGGEWLSLKKCTLR